MLLSFLFHAPYSYGSDRQEMAQRELTAAMEAHASMALAEQERRRIGKELSDAYEVCLRHFGNREIMFCLPYPFL